MRNIEVIHIKIPVIDETKDIINKFNKIIHLINLYNIKNIIPSKLDHYMIHPIVITINLKENIAGKCNMTYIRNLRTFSYHNELNFQQIEHKIKNSFYVKLNNLINE